jgi:hypothetical protein
LNKYHPRDRTTEDELLDVLTAISVVSMRLARKLTLLTRQRQSLEGVKKDERISHNRRKFTQRRYDN